MKNEHLKFAICLGASLLLAPAYAQPAQILPGHVPHALTRFQLKSNALPVTNRLSLVIGLPLRNRQLLTNLINDIYDPASTNYHRFLSPEQFTESFGPSQEDYRALISFVEANGLTVTGTHSNRTLLDVQAPVADLQRVFHVTLRVYQHPEENRTFFAPGTEPSLDLSVPVLHVTGLDDYVLPRPNLVTMAKGPPAGVRPNVGSGPNGAYMGNDFRRAYVPGVSLTGAGQVVGLLEFDGYDPNDIARYETKAGLASVPLQNVLLPDGPDRFSGSPGEHNDEVCLDIEMAISMAPGLSKVVVYEVPHVSSPYWLDILNEMIFPTQGQPLANQLSCSWTLPRNASADQAYQQLIIQGQSFFQSSGDYGAYYPGSDEVSDNPYVTIVGGTTLSTDSGGAWQPETTWNDGNRAGHFWASGGGTSQTYSIPSWQKGVADQLNQGSSSMRNSPDVAMVASSIWVTYNRGEQRTGSGGTSAATPLWAGFMALVNQQAAANGEPKVGFINPAIYAIGTGPNYRSAFHDVDDYSNNGNDQAVFWAVPGYDLCTGWGTPNGLGLINLLAPPPPHIDSVSPRVLLTSPSQQPFYIYGSGFTSDSTLLFNGSIASDASRLHFKSASEIDYDLIVQSADTWSVQVVKGIQRSNSKNFTVSNPSPTTGTLVVNLLPDGIGAQWQVDGTEYNNSGQAVGYLTPGLHQITFKPVSGYTTPASQPVTITADAQTTVNASYTAIQPSTYTLTLNYNNTQGGASPSPSASGNIYTAGAIVQLYASASFGFHFTGWSGDAGGTANPITITMNGNKNVTANFAPGDPTLGTLTVTIEPPAAAAAGVTWGFNASDFRASGSSYTTWPGTYILSVHAVEGWLGPAYALATITAGQTANVTVTYAQDMTPGLLTVTLTPPNAASAGGAWHVNGSSALASGATASLLPGAYTVTFDSIPGWATPASQPATVTRNQTTVIAANYTPPVGQPGIVSVQPGVGALAGGTLLTIRGYNFTVPATVFVGGLLASNVTVVSGSQISCYTPPNSVYGSASVVVQTSGGSSTNLNGFAYGSPRGSGIELAGSIGGWVNAVAVQGSYCYFGEGSSFVVLDVSNPAAPTAVGRVALPGMIQDIALFSASGRQYAVVADDDAGLQVVDVTSPAAPALRGYYATGDTALGVAVSGGNAYVGNGNSGLVILDISDPTRVRKIGAVPTSGLANKMAVQVTTSGVLAYLVNGGALLIVDVSDPHNPTLRGQTGQLLANWYIPNSVAVSGNRAFLGDGFTYLQGVDTSNPDSPQALGAVSPYGDGAAAVATAGGRVFTFGSLGFTVYDVTAGTLLHPRGSVHSSQVFFGNTMTVLGSYAYCAGGENGLYIYSVGAPDNPTLSGSSGATAGFYNSVAVNGNYAYLATENSGLKVFGVSDPANPTMLSQFASGGGGEVVYRANRAFVAGPQIKILDVTNPNQTPVLLGTSPNQFYAFNFYLAGSSIVAAGFDTTFSPYKAAIAVLDASNPAAVTIRPPLYLSTQNGGAYAVTGNGNVACVAIPLETGSDFSLAVINVSNPSSLQQIGKIPDIGVVATMQMAPDNRYLHVGCRYGDPSWKIVDLANSSSPVLVSSNYVGAAVSGIALSGSTAYLAAGWRGVLVYDVSNPTQPRLLRQYDTPGNAIGISVSGATLYVADSRGGLSMLELSDIDPPEVFITTPTFSPVYTNSTGSLNLGGTADDNVGLVQGTVTRVTWSNSRGGSGAASGTASWLANGITLSPGTNVLTVVAFDQAGNSGSDTLTVIYQAPKQDQAITFQPIADREFGDPPVSLTAAASSGLLVSFSVVSGPASLSNNALTLFGAGTVTVQASQPGNGFFNPAPPTNVSFTVAKADQAVAFAPLPNKSAGDPPFALSAMASSGLLVYFAVVSGPAVLDTNNIVTLLGGGLVTVSASQPGNSNYKAAATVQRSFNVSKVPQTITFGALSRQTVGDAPFALSASASSGLLVSFAVVSGPAVLSGNILTVTGKGLVTVRASQDGNATNAAAATVDQSFYVIRGVNLISDFGQDAQGAFHFTFAGEFGRPYVVELSANLADWTPVATNTLDAFGNLTFTDVTVVSRQKSFYRVRTQ